MKISHSYEKEIKRYMSDTVPWENLNGKTILVAGATGMIGACLVNILRYRNRMFDSKITIIVMSRSREQFQICFPDIIETDRIVFHQADISREINIEEKVDYVIHAASDGDPLSFSKSPVEVMKANFNGMDNAIQAVKNQEKVRILYVSSGEVYGQSVEGQIFDEDFCGYVDHSKARSCYPVSKRAAEVLCQSYIQEYNADIVIARPCHIYGPDMKKTDSRVIAQFIQNAVSGHDIVMKSEGKQCRSLCYAFDCAEAILVILLKGACGETYNIASDRETVSIYELAKLVCHACDLQLKREIPDDIERRGYSKVQNAVLNPGKLYHLGWDAKTGIEDGIKRTIEIMKEGN